MAEIRFLLGENRIGFYPEKFKGQIMVHPVTKITGIIGGRQMAILHRAQWPEDVYFIYDEGVFEIWFKVEPEVRIKVHLMISTGFHAHDTVEILHYPPNIDISYSEALSRWFRKEVL